MSQQRATDLTCNETMPLDDEPRLSGHQSNIRRFQVTNTPSQGPFRVNYPPGQGPPQQKTYTASQIARPVASRSYTVANPAASRNVVGSATATYNIPSSSNTSTPIHRGFVAPNHTTRVIRPAPSQSDHHEHGPVTFTTHATHQVPIVRHPLDNRFDIHGVRQSHTPTASQLPSPFVNSLRLTQAPPAAPGGSKTAQGLLNVVQSMSRHNTSPSLNQFSQTLFGNQHFPHSTFGTTGASTSRIIGASPIIPHPRFSAQNNGSSSKVVQPTPGVVRFQTTTPAASMSHIQTPAIQRVQTTTPHIVQGSSGFVHPSPALVGLSQATVNTPSPRPSILRKPSTPGSAAKRKLGFGTDLPGTSAGTLPGASASPSMSSVRSIIQNTNDATNSVAKALGSVAAPVTNGAEGESPRKRPRKQQFDNSQHEPMMMAVGMEAIKTPIWELPRDHPMAQEYFRNMQMIPPEKKKRGRPRADATRSSATADQFMVQTGVRRVFVPMDQLPNQALSHIAQQQNQIINPGLANPAAAAIAAAMEAAGLGNTFNTQASTSRNIVGNTLHNINPHQTVKEALSQMAADKAKVDMERKNIEQEEAKARDDALAQARATATVEQLRAAVVAAAAAKGAPAKGRPTAEKKRAAAAAAAAATAACSSKAAPSKKTAEKEGKDTPAPSKKGQAKKKTTAKKTAPKTKKTAEKVVREEEEEEIVREKPKVVKNKKMIKKKSVKVAKKVATTKAPPKQMTAQEQEMNVLCYLTTLMRNNLKQKALMTKMEKVKNEGLLNRYFPDKYRQVDEPVATICTNKPKLSFKPYNSRWNHFKKIENLKKAYEDKKHARKIKKLDDNIRKRLRKQCMATAKSVMKKTDPKLRHFCKLNNLTAPELKGRKKFVKLLTKVYMNRAEAFVKTNYPYFPKKNEKQREAEVLATEKKQADKKKQTEFAMRCIRLLKKRVRTGKVEKKFTGKGDAKKRIQTFSKKMDGYRYEFTASETRKKRLRKKKVLKTKKARKTPVKKNQKKIRKVKKAMKTKPSTAKLCQSKPETLTAGPSSTVPATPRPTATKSPSAALTGLVSALQNAVRDVPRQAIGSDPFGPSTSSAGPSTSFSVPGPSTSKALSTAYSASDAFCPKVLVSLAGSKVPEKKPMQRRIIKVANEDEIVARLLADSRTGSLSPAVQYVVATPEELKKDKLMKKRKLRRIASANRKEHLQRLQHVADRDQLSGLKSLLKKTAERDAAAQPVEVKKDLSPEEEAMRKIVREAKAAGKLGENNIPVKVEKKLVSVPVAKPVSSVPAVPVISVPVKVPVPSVTTATTVPTTPPAAQKPKPAQKSKDIRPQDDAQPVEKNIRDSIKESIKKYNSSLKKLADSSEKNVSTEQALAPPSPKKNKVLIQPWQILRSKKVLKEMGMWKSKNAGKAPKNATALAQRLKTSAKPKKVLALRRISLRTIAAKRIALKALHDLKLDKLIISCFPNETKSQKLMRQKKKEHHNKKVTKFFAYLEKTKLFRVISKKRKIKKLERKSTVQKNKSVAGTQTTKKVAKKAVQPSLKAKKTSNMKTTTAASTTEAVQSKKKVGESIKTGKKADLSMKNDKKPRSTEKSSVKKTKKTKKTDIVKRARFPLTRTDKCAIEEVVDSLVSAVSFDIDKDQKEKDAYETRAAIRKVKGRPIMSHGQSELKRVLEAQKSRQRMTRYSLDKVFPPSPSKKEHKLEDFDFRSDNVFIPTDYERNKDWWPVVSGPQKERSRESKTRAEKRQEKKLRLLQALRAEMKQKPKKRAEKSASKSVENSVKERYVFVAPAENQEKKLSFSAFKKLLTKMHPSKKAAILKKIKKRMFDVKRNLCLKHAEDKLKRKKACLEKKKKEKKAKRKLKKLKKIKKAKRKAAKLAAAQAAAEMEAEAKRQEMEECLEGEGSSRFEYDEGLTVPPVAMEVEVETTIETPKKKPKGRCQKKKKTPVKRTTIASPVEEPLDYRDFLRPIDREYTFADVFDEFDTEAETEVTQSPVATVTVRKVKKTAKKSSGKSKVLKEKTSSTKMSKQNIGQPSNRKVKRICLNPARRHLICLYGRGIRISGTKRYRMRIRKAKKTLKQTKKAISERRKEHRATMKESKKYKLALEKAKWLRNGRGSKETKKFLLQEWKLKIKSMKKVRKLKKKRREAKKKLNTKKKAERKTAIDKLVKEQGMKPTAARRQVNRTIKLPYTHPTAQDIAVMRLRDYQETLLEQLDTDRKVLLMFEQYLKTWDPASYNKLQKDIVRDYEPGDSSDMVYRKKLARIRVTLLRPQIELPPPKRPPNIESCDNVVVINPSKATMNSTFTNSSPFWEAPTCSKNDNNRRILRNGHITSDRPDDWKPLNMTPRIIYPDEMEQWCTEEQRERVLSNLDAIYEKYLARLGPDDPIDVPDHDPEEFEDKPVVQGVSRRTLKFKHKGNEEVTFLGEVNKPKLVLVDETDSPINRPKTRAHWSMNREILATSYKDIYDTSCLMVQTMLHMKASLCPEVKEPEVALVVPEPVVVETKKPAPPPRAKKTKTGKKAQKQKAAAQAKKDSAKKEPAKPRAGPKHPRAPRTPVITESTFERQIRRAIQESLKSMPSTSRV